MRLVMSFLPRPGKNIRQIALPSDRFLIRCAAQSDVMWSAGTPHTFSVYVLKKMRYRRHPKRAAVQPSKFDWSFGGRTRTHRYDRTQRTDSIGPRLRRALPALSG